MKHKSSLQPLQGANRSLRRRLSWQGELTLALAPTAVVLAVLAVVESFSHQRLLFASLAASAFLIYLDPQHGTNSVRTLAISQVLAASIGFSTHTLWGASYLSGGSAMVITIGSTCFVDMPGFGAFFLL